MTPFLALASLVLAFGALVLALIRDIVKDLAGQEARAWIPHLTRRFLTDATSLLPRDARGRYYTEWSAELATLADRPITQLLFAWDLRRAARVISRELHEQDRPAVARMESVVRPIATRLNQCGAFLQQAWDRYWFPREWSWLRLIVNLTAWNAVAAIVAAALGLHVIVGLVLGTGVYWATGYVMLWLRMRQRTAR